jgi:hypothetical protein
MLLATLFALPAIGQPAQINVSTDLVNLGIATQNAVPGNPNLDARPLFQAAIQYAAKNGVPLIVANPGSYWFLTTQESGVYLVLNNISNLTLNLQGSALYFQNSFQIGIYMNQCQSVTLSNFSVDYVNLPFTQVQLTGVNTTNSTLSYTTIAGWPSPTALQSPDGSTAYWGIVLRNGSPIANASRLQLAPPTSSSALQIVPGTDPWAQPNVIGTYQPGDVIVVTLRDGDSTILVEAGNNITISGVDIFSSSALGLHEDSTSNSTISKVRVIPRPGTDHLISTNADGIQLSFVQANNTVESCHVSHTLDDGIALNSPFIAFVTSVTGTRVLTTRNFQASIPNGAAVAFINPATGQTSAPFSLTSQSPNYVPTPASSQTATYVFNNQTLPTLQSGFGIVYANESNRGAGSIVQNNVIEDILFARGIFLGGVGGVIVQQNVVRRTNCGGIVIHHDLAGYPSAANQDIQVLGNDVDQAIGPAAVGTGAITALGSIFVLATDENFVPLPTPTATNITIQNNYISNSGRCALWIANVENGTVQGNTIAGYALYPNLAIWGVSETLAADFTVDFTQAVAVHNNVNLNVQ